MPFILTASNCTFLPCCILSSSIVIRLFVCPFVYVRSRTSETRRCSNWRCKLCHKTGDFYSYFFIFIAYRDDPRRHRREDVGVGVGVRVGVVEFQL